MKNSKAEPLKVFVPDLVVTVIAAPAAIPVSASMLPVVMLTDSIVSAGATYAVWCGIVTNTFIAPSVRVGLAFPLWPLTVMLSERCGVSVSAFWKTGGSEPGTRTTSAW